MDDLEKLLNYLPKDLTPKEQKEVEELVKRLKEKLNGISQNTNYSYR